MRPPELLLTLDRRSFRSLLALATLAALGVVAAPSGAAGTGAAAGSAGTTEGAQPGSDEVLRFPLEGTRWRLDGYRDPDGMMPVAPEVVARLTLAEGRARAGVGCGPIRAAYSSGGAPGASGASLSPQAAASVSPQAAASGPPVPAPSPALEDAQLGVPLLFAAIEPSSRACAVPTAAVGEALVEGLAATSTYVIEPGGESWQAVLRLRDAGGSDVLAFRVDDASSLTLGQWLLPTAAADPPVLSFDPRSEGRRSRGRVLGSTGCNSLAAGYILEGSLLRLRGLETSELACAAPAAALESAILAVLMAPSLEVELPPSRLVIRDPLSDDVLEYVSERPLEGPTWLLTELSGRDLGALTVTLRLEAGVVNGEGPCGPFAGAYRTNGVLISLSGLGGGQGECPERRSERAFLRALRDALFVDARDPELILLDENGRRLATLRRPGAL